MLPARPPEAARENNKKDVPGAGSHDQNTAPVRSCEGRRENRGTAGSFLGLLQRNLGRILGRLTMKRVLGKHRANRHNHPYEKVLSSAPGKRPRVNPQQRGHESPRNHQESHGAAACMGKWHTPRPRRPSYLRIPRRLITSRYFFRSCSRKYLSRPDRFETIMSSPRRLAWSLACVLK